jgi:large subunit ribosomal protein L25
MAKDITLEARGRSASGTGNARRLRRDGVLPGIVYYRDTRTRMIALDQHTFEQMLRHRTSENMMVQLVVDGAKPETMLLKDVQHDPMTRHVLHVDFSEVSLTETMRVRIPIELTGESKGVTAGGVLEHVLREIEVECLPGDLVERFDVDVTALRIGEHLTVADMTVPGTFTVVTEPDVVVAAVAAPRTEDEEKPEAEGAEPEVIGAKEESEGEEADGASSGGKD